MTDTFYPVTTITGHDTLHASLPNSVPFLPNHRYGALAVDGSTEEEDSIACFCGYADDDGNTVACDKCNRWQHTLCYYPEFEGRSLPEQLEHYCVDCRPREVDVHAANTRQRYRREQQEPNYNGAKRQAPKSHKKKVKDAIGAPYTNGWPMDKARHDRNSASPRDQPPPAKRPKTSHRNSDSATPSSGKGHGHLRKRTATNVNHRRSLSQSPETPIEPYSEEFMRCYHDDQWYPTDSNVMDTLQVTNALSRWLQDPDEVFYDNVGAAKHEVLSRWDGEAVDDIPGRPQLLEQEHHDQNLQDDDGNHPMWKTITVQDPVAAGGYIGELRGRIGFKDEYKSEPSNRWASLRHPEPFVFFHPRLPIYVDARHEGTKLRYVRRSCNPNAILQVLITGGTEYHFCFMATTVIEPGMEIAVSWDTSDSIMPRTHDSVSHREMDQLSLWVSTVLANCGPCACQLPPGSCYMSRFDRRRTGGEDEDEAQSVKMPKAKKKRAGHHISPLNTHVVNSRSGSEARKVDPDDEPTDSRSASGSRGSGSRDITPNTHYSANGSLSAMPELSERERKKLAKEEEMFRRQEEEQSGKSKKKRNSGGSSLNTPSATTSKQMSIPGNNSRYADAGTSKQAGLPSAKPLTTKRPRASTMQSTPVKEGYVKVVKKPKPKPLYVDAETQCDLDQEDAERKAAQRVAAPRRKYISVTQRLLQRCAINNVKANAAPGISSPAPSPGSASPMHIDFPTGDKAVSPRTALPEALTEQSVPEAELESQNEASDDVQMSEAPANEHYRTKSDTQEPPRPPGTPAGLDHGPLHQPAEPPVPPWASRVSPASPEPHDPEEQSQRPAHMHLDMPPPQSNPFGAPVQPLTASSSNSITGSIAQSPASLNAPPMFSPSVTAAVTPSPAKKKLSLSDYTKRSKAKDKEHEPRRDRDSSPASVASGPIVPPLQASSSEIARAEEGGSAIEDDVKMEDAGAMKV